MYINCDENLRYYASNDSIPCDCVNCKLYINRIEKEYPRVCDYLRTLDIDPLRPFELILLEFDDHVEYYACQYIAFGSCEDSYSCQIDEVIFGTTDTHPDTHIEDKEHFVLDLGPITLKKS